MAAKDDKPGTVVKLAEFISQKRRAECAVCSLPAEVRTQVTEGRTKKKYAVAEIIEWLTSAGYKITRENFTTHSNGHHDDKAA